VITVSILINGQPLFTRSAVNTRVQRRGKTIYSVDDGSFIAHARDKGAIALAVALLKTIKPPSADPCPLHIPVEAK
jgi:hypothetical protein